MKMKKFLVLLALIGVVCAAGCWFTAAPAHSAEAARKPALLFLSRDMALHTGGWYLRQNMARLDRAGYRVAYHSFDELERKPVDFVLGFDAVVFLFSPTVDHGAGRLQAITPALAQRYGAIKKLLKAGGGVLLFPQPGEHALRGLWPLMEPHGVVPLTRALDDLTAVPGPFEAAQFASTQNIARHPLTAGVQNLWYPVASEKGGKFGFDTLRNANTLPFDVDANWTVLARAAASTRLVTYEKTDSLWLQQPQFNKLPTGPVPLVAVRDDVEGKGRLAVCGINAVYSDFIAGNFVYDGVATGKGLEGKPAHLDRLLMNVLDWLAAPSLQAGRKTIAASDRESFAIEPFRYPPPLPVDGKCSVGPIAEQFEGIVGARSTHSGGQSTVAEYAKAARELGLDYVVFLEDFSVLKLDEWEKFQQKCAQNSDAKCC